MKGLLPYEFVDKKITPWGGMRLIKEFYDRIGMFDKLRQLALHREGSAVAVKHHEIIESFMMSVILGAGSCSGASQISYDEVLKEIFQWEKGMPSQSTLSRFFPKYTQQKSDEIFSDLNQWWFNELGYTNLTLDVDSTVITRFGHQEGAEKGYNPKRKGRKSHHPIIAFLAEPKMIANAWMRTGDSASSTEFKEFLDNTFTMVPRESIGLLRGDSGFCSNNILKYLEKIELKYIIAMPMKSGLVDRILEAKKWVSSERQGVDLCSFLYKARGWSKYRRIVVVRKDVEKLPNCGGKTLFSQQDDYLRYRYSAFVTTSEYSDQLVWLTYDHDRGQLAAALAQHAQGLVAGVVEHQYVLDCIGEDARCRRQRAQLLAATHQHLIEDAVIAVGEDGNRLTSGDRARHPHRAHHRFGTGIAETDALVAGEFGDQFRDLCGQRMLRADFDATGQLVLHRRDH